MGDTLCLNVKERKRVDAMEIKCMRNMCGVRRIDRVRNERVRESCGSKVSLIERADRRVLKWFEHVVRMSNKKIIKKVYKSSVNDVRDGERPRRRWSDGVRDILVRWGWSIREAERVVGDCAN